MSEEIEEWIKEKNPYRHPTGDWVDDYQVWANGARAMAEHLQGQPPTRELIKKIFTIYLQPDFKGLMGWDTLEDLVEEVYNTLKDEMNDE